MRRFNTTGKCNPEIHYMVNIDRQVEDAVLLVGQGDYFCINRGRQYGKTTTLNSLATRLKDDYCVFNISFEGLDDSVFSSVGSACAEFLKILRMHSKVNGASNDMKKLLINALPLGCNEIGTTEFTDIINELCGLSPKPIVVMIDEVDQASNNDGFIKFLGVLRKMFLARETFGTFWSVILAGVYDVKNLKLKIRTDNSHQYNSPWNIAVPFNSDMNLPAEGIAGMLEQYKHDHNINFNSKEIGQLIYDYTSGYPFLVSRLCQIIDQEKLNWDKNGTLRAVNLLLKEGNTLFDDIHKKITQFPGLSDLLKSIIFGGQRVAFNYYDTDINIASIFNFVKDDNGTTKISCRIFETWLYNYYISLDKSSTIYQNGEYEKSQFVHNGFLDMKGLIERFSEHFNEIYRPEVDDKFVEDNGRKIFLTYLRPIINGVGNYYCEAQTRDLTRTDIIIDYLGQQYIIELKIWRGNAYNERGEQQLIEHLDYYRLQTGFMVSFCFNKNKQPGIREVQIGERKIIEAIV